MTTTTLPVHREVVQLMGLPISLALRGRHAGDAAGQGAWAAALAVLDEVDRTFSTYRDDSWISRLNRGEVGIDDCPPEVAEVLALGEQARIDSAGAFDVRRRDATGRVRLDPSGVVKGWAVERAAPALRALDDTDFCLSAGGDMVCVVTDPDRPAWRIGVEDPHRPDRVFAVVPIRQGAIATSGLHRRGAHIVDARTGQVPTGVASVTVLDESLTWADIDATSAFAQGPDCLAWLTNRGRSGAVVWPDGRTEIFGTPA